MKYTGLFLVTLAVFFNLPFARLAATFDYPDILRQPAGVILTAFTAGGPALIATWYGFALAALLFIPAALAHAFTNARLTTAPALAISAALIGVLSAIAGYLMLTLWMITSGLLLIRPWRRAGVAVA